MVAGIIDEPLLVEMIFCPILYLRRRGGARHRVRPVQHSLPLDLSWRALPGRWPESQRLLKMLVRRFKEHGGELRLRAAVEKIVVV